MKQGAGSEVELIRSTRRVSMADVDAAGVIFYVAPYLWREVLFTQWLYDVGHSLSTLIAAGTPPPCVTSSAEYLGPVRLDDSVDLTLTLERVGRSSFDLRMDGIVAGARVVVVRTTNVWTQRAPHGLRSAALPEWFLDLGSPRS